MLKACRVGRYKSIHSIANVAAKLRRSKPEVSVRLLDAVLDELQWSIEHPAFKDQQRTLTLARLLGEMHVLELASFSVVIATLYEFLNCGHEIHDALREASAKVVSTVTSETDKPVLNSASGVSGAILEDEEMDEHVLETKEELKETQPVAVSIHSKYDPRVPTNLDPPNSVFRVKLVCTLLEVSAKSLVSRNNLPKLEAFLIAFQRYLFTKSILPTEVEFSLLDTFDIIDSEWRRFQQKDQTKKDSTGKDEAQGFPRYGTWLEAHNKTVALEEAEAAIEAGAKLRLESRAGVGELSGEATTVASESYNDDEDGLDDDGEDYDSAADDTMSASAKDSLADDFVSEHASEDEAVEELDEQDESQATGSVDGDGEESDIDSDDSEDEEDGSEDEDEFDEEAYMQQLEAEAFEAELRRLTMDALEKGKSTARGGKVSDSMPSGSQFIKKKQAEITETQGPTIALGGKEGISFNLLKKGNKGKLEAKQFFVPKDTNLAAVATKQDDEAAKERDVIKARVLQYEAESAESTGGNVYLEQEKLTVIRNRPLSMDEIDKNFGTTGGNLLNSSSRRGGSNDAGRGGRGFAPGRGRGRSSGRGLV
jgi:regulator of nonsense transcripts 2